MAAILFEYPTIYDPDDMMMRALTRVTQVLQGLVDLNLANLHQVVTHRRDTALDARLNLVQKPVKIEEDHLVSLRSGPILGEVDQATLRQVKQEREIRRRLNSFKRLRCPSLPIRLQIKLVHLR